MLHFRRLFVLLFIFHVNQLKSQDLYIGTSSIDITPQLPVALLGQFHIRIADTVESPLIINVVALESRENGALKETVVFVACDLTVIPPSLTKSVRKEVARRIPGFDTDKIILTATHTHTAPVLGNENLVYPIPPNITQIDTYHALVTQRAAEAIEKAWNNRQQGTVTWGLSQAAVGYNRRSYYSNGKSVLAGGGNTPLYRGPESTDDHDVNVLFFWNKKGKLIAMNIDVPAPAQQVGGRNTINADFWHETRIELKKRFGNDICVVGWVGAAGNQGLGPLYRKPAEERMLKLRNTTKSQEIARRITVAVQDAYDVVKNDRFTKVPMMHAMDTLMLPMRKMSEAEYIEGKMESEKAAAAIAADSTKVGQMQAQMLWYQAAVKRFEMQYTNPKMESEIHVIRIGDAVVCTNPFELFTEFGMRIQGRSKAVQTFVVQLAGAHNYLPTVEAENNGGYSVIMQSSFVGAAGGDILVDRTVDMINKMWSDKK